MAAPFQALPEGIYFNPSAEECVRDYLRPWIAGVRPATDRIITDVNIYSDSPAALLHEREPGFSRNFEYKWFMLTQCVLLCGGKNRGKARAKRDVATGGNWKVEQKSKGIAERAYDDEDDPPGGDRRRTNGFYLPLVGAGGGGGKGTKKDGVKTPWLMEELTTAEDEAAAVGGWKGPRTIQVFCKLYVSPRATNDEKRDIFGEDGVPADLPGHMKTVTAELSDQFFYAVAENLDRNKVQGPPAPPRALGHQQGQPAAPRVPGHHHGHTVMPRGVPARPHQIQGNLGFQRGQTAPRQIQAGGPSQYHGVAVHPHQQHVLDPYHHFQFQEAAFYHYSAPSFVRLDPRQGEEMIHVEKRPRLAYCSPSPPAQPQGGADSDMSSCVVQASTSQEQGQGSDTDAEAKVLQGEPVLTPSPSPSPPQENPGTSVAAPPAPAHHVSAAAPPELGGDACKPTTEPMRERDMFMDLPILTPEPFVADEPDFLMHDLFKPPFTDEPQPPLGFDVFSLDELTKDSPNFWL